MARRWSTWSAPSRCEGWSVRDVLAHLAATEVYFRACLDGGVGALMEEITTLPAGDLIVFLLAGTIAAAAFMARRYETRRLIPAHA